jgi:hypothetical protein
MWRSGISGGGSTERLVAAFTATVKPLQALVDAVVVDGVVLGQILLSCSTVVDCGKSCLSYFAFYCCYTVSFGFGNAANFVSFGGIPIDFGYNSFSYGISLAVVFARQSAFAIDFESSCQVLPSWRTRLHLSLTISEQ